MTDTISTPLSTQDSIARSSSSSDQSDAPLLVRTWRGEQTERTPVWFMRQAGRSLPEYHEAKAGRSLLDVVKDPALAAEITLQPVRRHGVDAAILYSDIVTPLAAMNLGIEIKAGIGPVIEQPIRTATDVDRIGEFRPDEHAPYVQETVRLVRRELAADTALIGFAGAPFTVASYLVEGGPSKQQARTRAMMLGEPELWNTLGNRIADITIASLVAQIDAGAQAVQIFDSWIGSLSAAQYERHVLPIMQRIMTALEPSGVPRVLFGIGTGHLLEQHAATGADVVGVDWRTSLTSARARLGDTVGLQGNLDPITLLAGWSSTEQAVGEVLADAPRERWVFNLGHGVLPDTAPDIPTRITALVHEETSR
jgi:uroporphyrinogen decarboxylase